MRKLICGTLFFALAARLSAANLDTIGVTLLQTIDPSLKGSGIIVAHVEPPTDTNEPPPFEVNPGMVGQPASLFTYLTGDGTATNFPNSIGVESYHADQVAGNFYGTAGVAPLIARVYNYEANYFYQDFIANPLQPAINGRIVNQSFIFGTTPPQSTLDLQYDNFAAKHNVLFISGAGNGVSSGNNGFVNPPATCYNGIAVGVTDGASSFGPTIDNGRSKPDIVAPGLYTSFSTPYVSGAAAILMQAGLRGDGGAGTTNTAADVRTIKALLLNGAVKPTNWANSPTRPLDTNFGAGVLNVFSSFKQLAGGQHTETETTSVVTGNAHPPGVNTNNISARSGWDFNSITSTITLDRVNHYYFDLTNFLADGGYTLTTTLAWLRQQGATNAKNLNLFLYDISGNAVASSVSLVDNVEHIFIPSLPPGRYDLQVWKAGGVGNNGSETYALAFEIFTMPLSVQRSTNNAIVSWPIAPTGFRLQSTTSLNPPILWSNVNASLIITNNQNVVTLPMSGAQQYFRLVRP